jgi:Protein of unknown function (DUF4242)
VPKYVIERDIPNAGSLTEHEIQAISQKSCSVVQNLGPQIQWLHSYVTDDKIYCVYIAPNEEMVREHAKQGGFPANRVSEVKRMIDPTSAEADPDPYP